MEYAAMQFIVWIETVIAGKSVAVHRVAAVERKGVNDPTEQGLTLQDGKVILNGIEQDIVQTQVDLQSGCCRACVHCQQPQRVKDMRKRRLDTVFGRVTVRCRRFVRCTCRGGKARNLWPLAHWAELGMKRSTPERTYLLAELSFFFHVGTFRLPWRHKPSGIETDERLVSSMYINLQ
jgi:hypothetical protein